jgi:xylulose-5-phosphate/fructose-6-phosphate phosphoketolase
MKKEQIGKIKKYLRAANFLTASQIYLQDNYLLEREIRPEDIKPRLLGHWGTCPGINFVNAHLNRWIKDHDLDVMYVVGTGHGFPGVQANLFLEKTLGEFYPKAKHSEDGIAYISKNFSWPYGFPSHSSPETPGIILEGGELGYALSTSYGSILDNPELITVALIGDGENETGPSSTAWHLNKLIDPETNGTVLPILHLNGYKISGPTFFGRMSDEELTNLYKGYGYVPAIVDFNEEDEDEIHEKMFDVLEDCISKIKTIKEKARNGEKEKPQFPMIVLRTPKGWTGVKEFDGKKIEGNHWSHQVAIKNAREDEAERKALQDWFSSYKFTEIFDKHKGFDQDILDLIPQGDARIGMNKHAFGGERVYKPLVLPDLHKHAEDATKPGTVGSSSMRRVGDYLNDVFKLNKDAKNFRLMSPDETYSNKLDKVFETTSRAFVWPHEGFDDDISYDGRVMEMLSEHSLQGLSQGYTLTGRHCIFASYEAFIQVVVSMFDQYAKFLKIARTVSFREDVPSFNYILTSSGWRQDHNGFSHQNPGFLDTALQKPGCFVNVYLPADGNTALAVIERMLSSKNEINVLSAGKTLEPRWRTVDQAKEDLEKGIAIWDFATDENPDIVFAGVGDYMTKEALAAVELLKKEIPNVRVRFVNISTLGSTGIGANSCMLNTVDFDEYFTKNKPVIFNFHGYPQTLKQILFDYYDSNQRFKVNGYIENGSTTTPFDMQVRNRTDRFHLVMDAVKMLSDDGLVEESRAEDIKNKYETKLKDHSKYIREHGIDPDEIEKWEWS